MNWLWRLLRNLVLALGNALAALLKLLVLLIILLPLLLWLLITCLCHWLRERNLYPHSEEEHCGKLPEAAVRRPDPCIYSQQLLMSQGLPVTWNNPDIWLARAATPGVIEPDSYHLQDDTDYIVSVRAHNASTDAAIGVRVRLNYRPWSFGSPDLTPVQVDGSGNEVVRFVNIAPLGSALAQFIWRTPPVPAGAESRHYCLQASLYHPLDTDTANNMGQENTQVYRTPNPGFARPGEVIALEVPLHNMARRAQRFVFTAMRYEIGAPQRVALKLQRTVGHARMSTAQRLANALPTLHVGRSLAVQAGGGGATTTRRAGAAASNVVAERPGGLRFEVRQRLKSVKTRYVGLEALRQQLAAGDYRLPEGMRIAIDGAPLEQAVHLEAKTERKLRFEIKVPDNAPPGATYPVNLVARTEAGALLGGVTVLIRVQD